MKVGGPGAIQRQSATERLPLAADSAPPAGSVARARLRTVPGDGLLHPLALGSIAVLVVNDHILKAAWPGLVTGKLSDFAGLVFFPLLLVAFWEVASAIVRRRWRPSIRVLLVAAAVTAIGFAAVKVTAAGNALATSALGQVQWLLASVVSSVVGGPPARFAPVAIVMDAGDLVALGAVAVSAWIGYQRIARSCGRSITRRGRGT